MLIGLNDSGEIPIRPPMSCNENPNCGFLRRLFILPWEYYAGSTMLLSNKQNRITIPPASLPTLTIQRNSGILQTISFSDSDYLSSPTSSSAVSLPAAFANYFTDKLVKQCSSMLVPSVTKVVILSLTSGIFLHQFKHSIFISTVQKTKLEQIVIFNYRPMTDLPFPLSIDRTVHQVSAHGTPN